LRRKEAKNMSIKKHEERSIHEEVMKKIHDENVHMKPKMYFIAGSTLLGFGTAGGLVVAGFFTHVILYRVRFEEAFEYLGFGTPGIQPFVLIFPWKPFFIAIGGLLGGLVLLRNYDFSYKRNITGLVVATIFFILAMAAILDNLSASGRLQNVWVLENMYESSHSQKSWINGVVSSIEGHNMTILTKFNGEVVAKTDKLESIVSQTNIGEKIKAIGYWEDGTFVIKHLRTRD
jgi:hypothetical protein